MEFTDLISSETVQLTVVPGILVVLVLFFWFRRSGPRARKMKNGQFGRAANSRHDNLEFLVGPDGADVYLGRSHELDQLGDEILAEDREALAAGEPVPRKAHEAPEPVDAFAQVEKAPRADSEEQQQVLEHLDTRVDGSDKEERPSASGASAEELKNGLMLVLNVVSKGRPLRGSAILKAITSTGLTYGPMGIFHYYSPTRPAKQPLFSVANMMEPGSFNLNNMEEVSTLGLILFANVARPEEGSETFTAMLETAKRLADLLGATVCDERRGTLSKQGIEHIQGQIQEHQRRSRLEHAAHA